MDRLLTDDEIRWIVGNDPSSTQLEVLVESQDAKTLKAVAEWMLDRCTEHIDQHYPLRFLCKLCMLDVVYSALHKGLLPGEKE